MEDLRDVLIGEIKDIAYFYDKRTSDAQIADDLERIYWLIEAYKDLTWMEMK